jgi:hypothetical protein
MGLTRIRAEQISDIDYKQATRAISVTNVTLAGGAPASVDGVSVVVNDRVLVTGQTTGSENGLYKVQTVGNGSNGTWVRTSDGNETGEIEAGMIVMVTEGLIYADTQWKLITNNPIVIGSTVLTFTQNYSANSVSSGTSNVVVNSNSSVTISSAGTANVLVITATGANIAGTLNATGNVTGNYFIGNGSQLTGVAVTSISNGTSNVAITTANANITMGINGDNNTVVISPGSIFVNGVFATPKNITSNVQMANNTNATVISPLTIADGYTMSVPDGSTVYIWTPT